MIDPFDFAQGKLLIARGRFREPFPTKAFAFPPRFHNLPA